MQPRIYAPAAGLETWKSRLADPEKQWVRGKSAFETAVFWELGARTPRGLHPQITALFDQDEIFRDCELLASFPEHRVPLPGGSRASQTDVWAILRVSSGLVSLAVEGKAGESFAQTVGEWRTDASVGRETRLKFLWEQLGFTGDAPDTIRYQLMHRSASALLEADRIGATAAVMLILSFENDLASKQDFAAFASCFGSSVSSGCLVRASTHIKKPFFFAWLDLPKASDADIAAVAI